MLISMSEAGAASTQVKMTNQRQEQLVSAASTQVKNGQPTKQREEQLVTANSSEVALFRPPISAENKYRQSIASK